MKVGLITGITGQDGSYLLDLLLQKNYTVYGIKRRSSTINTQRIDKHQYNDKVIIKYGDLSDTKCIDSLLNLIKKSHYDLERLEIYNLAAMSHVRVSFDIPEYSGDINGLGVTRILESIRNCEWNDKIRFYQASTSEMFGKVQEIPQTEKTPFYPRSPYGVAKVYGHWITINYRESYNLFCCSGILFNHESPRRHLTFVTQKICDGIKKIKNNELGYLELGNLDSKRDWGHTKDYVYGMWLMLQQDKPDDYILSTGTNYTVRTFCEKAFHYSGYDLKWKGTGLNEIGYDSKTNKVLIKINERFFRPTEVDELLGDSSKARDKLGWKNKISFDELIKDMLSY